MARPDAAGEGAAAPSSPARLLLLGVLALLAFAGLVALGTWQVERRAWKLALIERVEARVHAPAVAAPGPEGWATITAASAEYRHVSATGKFLNDRDTLVQAATVKGPGYWVLAPFRTEQGFLVLVNRGFVPADRRDRNSRAAGDISGRTTVTGLLRMTEPKGGFLRSNDPAGGRWYSRDVAAIAAAQGLPDMAPYFIDADATPNAGGLPLGGLTVIAFPNSHLVYAGTWYSLALMVAGAASWLAREEWRARRRREA
jgi:surfeit locus 1 family protein